MLISYKDKLYSSSYLATKLGLKSVRELNKILEAKGIQKKDNVRNVWRFTGDLVNKGYESFEAKKLPNQKEIYVRKFTWDGIIKIRQLLETK
ncbi:MAG: hypothetical protein ACRCXY_03520 [Fusobacteriaceae bacterium]